MEKIGLNSREFASKADMKQSKITFDSQFLQVFNDVVFVKFGIHAFEIKIFVKFEWLLWWSVHRSSSVASTHASAWPAVESTIAVATPS